MNISSLGSISRVATELGTGHLGLNPRSVEGYSAVDSVLALLNKLIKKIDERDSPHLFPAAVPVADVSNEDMLAIALVTERTAGVSLDQRLRGQRGE